MCVHSHTHTQTHTHKYTHTHTHMRTHTHTPYVGSLCLYPYSNDGGSSSFVTTSSSSGTHMLYSHLIRKTSEIQITGEPVGREIGRGAYGRVFTIKYRGSICAAKEIHPLLAEGVGQQQQQNVREGYLREYQHCSVLNHSNIVRFMGIYYPKKSSTIPIMIMELMGESLRFYIDRLPKNAAWMKKGSILIDVAEGLKYLHAQKPPVIHRDLSPNNILLKAGYGDVPVAKIGDLGVAKVIKADSRATQSVLTNVPGTVATRELW